MSELRRPLRVVRCVALLGFGIATALPAIATSELVDPTRPPHVIPSEAGAVERTEPWLLTAILVAKGRRVAVVNGRPVRAGDEVDGATVKEIARKRVVLATPDGDLALQLVDARLKPVEAHRP